MKNLGRLGFALLLLALSAAHGSAAPQGSESAPASPEIRYSYLISGNLAGSATSLLGSGGWWTYTFEYNDRGRGPKLVSQVRLDKRGLPVQLETRGHNYWKAPVEERFTLEGRKASWKNASENEERKVDGTEFYLSQDGCPEELALLARALLARNGRLDLLPGGQARLEKLGTVLAQAGGIGRSVQLYAISGLGLSPVQLWLDDQGGLFAQRQGWSMLIREGWESAIPALDAFEDGAKAQRESALASQLGRRSENPFVIRNAQLFDPATGEVSSGRTVVISGERIQAVGQDGEVQIPRRAEVLDAKGKMLLPGLWDMHAHLSAESAFLDIAAGVTTARDMANDIDQIRKLQRRFDAGEAIGPRVILAGFIDGPGPFAGPIKVLVDTEQEALAAVDRYASLGYEQIKLYSSLDPKLVPPILQRAHEKGLRVSGHIPNGLTAEQAVRAGFDEIQHINFLFLNFLDGVDTRTPARFTEVAAHAAELDLRSQRVRDFLALLKEKQTVIDPTVNVFEEMLGRPGQASPAWDGVMDRLPPQIQRSLRVGAIKAPEGQEAQYEKAFPAMLRMLAALHREGIPIVAGTDSVSGFGLHRELELYVQTGIPAPEVLRIATLGAARVMKKDKDLGSIAPGKLADLILVDGDPVADIRDIRRVVLTVRGGAVYDTAKLYEAIGVKPIEERRRR